MTMEFLVWRGPKKRKRFIWARRVVSVVQSNVVALLPDLDFISFECMVFLVSLFLLHLLLLFSFFKNINKSNEF